MTSSARSLKKPAASAARVLYLYAISEVPKLSPPPVNAEGIDGSAAVEALRCGNYLCWIARVAKADFADRLTEHMQNLEWLAATSLRHQRVVAEISAKVSALPARFGTVFLSEQSLSQHVNNRQAALRRDFERVAGGDEWGIKIFALAQPARAITTKAVSGSDYLKRKAQLMQPRNAGKLDQEVREFISTLTKLSAASSPGGKASSGQPGLLWHGSFLVPRKNQKKLRAALEAYATRWKDSRRIDCSGPWPPYSFVGDHVE